MHISDYSVPNDPLNHTFTPANAALSTVDGFTVLDLKVSAYTSGNVICAAVGTDAFFQYASVRTMLKSSPVEGIVEGNFFYRESHIRYYPPRHSLMQQSICFSQRLSRNRLRDSDYDRVRIEPECFYGDLGNEPGHY